MTTPLTEPPPTELAELVHWLRSPDAYDHATQSVELVETHISWVFLTDHYVYKLKKPVQFDFLDYSTLVHRRQDCRREVELGRRTAPYVYVGVIAVRRDRSGRMRFGGRGRVLAHLVKMRRLPEEHLLDQRIRSGKIEKRELDAVVRLLVRFYRSAASNPRITRFVTPDALRRKTQGNLHALSEHAQRLDERALRRVRAGQLQLLELKPDLFLERIRQRRIRDGHGDLRPEHVCLRPRPAIFDPVAFNPELRAVDPIDELAFLAAECEHLGNAEVGEYLLRQYIRITRDPAPPELVDFYRSYRACVRAKVELLRADQVAHGQSETERRRSAREHGRQAARYLAQADACVAHFYRPLLCITIGLMGSGKSTLATGLADRLGLEVLRSDLIRQELAGRRDRTAAYGAGIYDIQVTQRVYAMLLQRARRLLLQGASVILDATFLRRRDRLLARQLAERAGARYCQFVCEAHAVATLERLNARLRDPAAISDGRPELYLRQMQDFEPPFDEANTIRVGTTDDPNVAWRHAIRDTRKLALAQPRSSRSISVNGDMSA